MSQSARHAVVATPTVQGKSDSVIPHSFFDTMARLLQKMGDESRPTCRTDCPAMQGRLKSQHRPRENSSTKRSRESGPTARKKTIKGSLRQP